MTVMATKGPRESELKAALIPGEVVIGAFSMHVTKWVSGAERVVRTEYAALVAAKGDTRDRGRWILCDHRHRTIEVAVKCGERTAYQALRQNGQKAGASREAR